MTEQKTTMTTTKPKIIYTVRTITDVLIEGAHTIYQHRIFKGTEIKWSIVLVESRKDNRPSRLADDLRHQIMSVHNLTRITIADTAPDWKDRATLDRKPKGLTSILDHDKKGALEIWYQVTTPEHRATIYIRS